MLFLYDGSELVSVVYKGNSFYYIKNAMGDVIGIANGEGKQFVTYYYDAWGNRLFSEIETNNAIESAVADDNPMLYRGYYKDEDTSLYYLQSRYYMSNACRFLNADIPDIAYSSKDETNGLNLFAYCNNNPVNYVDSNGHAAVAISFAVAATIFCAVLLYVSISYSASTVLNNSAYRPSLNGIRSFGNKYNLRPNTIIGLLAYSFPIVYNYFRTTGKKVSKSISNAFTIGIADAEIKTKIKQDSGFDYWTATRYTLDKYSYVKIGNGIRKDNAINRIKTNKDVFSSSQNNAKSLAKSAYSNKTPVGPERHGSTIGYYYHYHVYKHKYNSHAFFLM